MGDTYKKSKGNAGLDGVQFQLNLLTVFLLNAMRNLKDWRISSENEEAGKYDDLVLELPARSVLLQAKFKQTRKITREQLLSNNSKNADFSLPKYFFSYLEIRAGPGGSKEKTVIICTNTRVDEKGLEDVLIRNSLDTDSLLHYEGDNYSFFTFNDNFMADLRAKAEVYLDKNLQGKGFDKGMITEENLRGFLENLQFFSDFPSGDKLNGIIEQLLSHLNVSKLCSKTSPQEIYRKVEEWFKQPRGEYLTELRAQAMFCEIRSEKYCDVLKGYNVSFRDNHLNFTEPDSMLHVTSERGCLLQTLKVYGCLQGDKSRKLYVNPDDDDQAQKQAVEVFGLSRYTFLIIPTRITEGTASREITGKLKEILEKFQYKKVIFVGESNDELNQQMKSKEILCIDGILTFEDFSEECQSTLLKKRNVNFQGRIVSLEELVGAQNAGDYAKAINPEILEKIIREEEIKVGTPSPGLDEEIAPYYIDRTFRKETDTTKDEEERTEEEGQTISEEEIYGASEKVVLISDSAGMGKSTVLTKLGVIAKRSNSHMWVIRINLNDYAPSLRDFQTNGGETIDPMELLDLRESTRLTNHLEKFVFSIEEKVVLLLDGVDEVCSDYTQLVLSLFGHCRDAPNIAKMFVTTRPHMISEMINIFKVRPFLLQPFTDRDQVDFLVSFWTHKLNVSRANKDKCETFAETLIDKMSSWVKLHHSNGRSDFSAVPLQIRMLAEIFQKRIKLGGAEYWEGCKEYLEGGGGEPRLPEKMNITELYRIFIEKERDVYLDKGNPSRNSMAQNALTVQFGEYLVHHRRLALNVMLDETERELFFEYQPNSREVEENMLQMGIVQKVDNEIQFVHRTFAEYFFAESIVVELQLQIHMQNVKLQQFLIDEVFRTAEYKVVRAFLDNILQRLLNSMPSNVFRSYQYFVYDLNYWMYGNNLIHSLAEEGCVGILQLVLKCIYFEIVRDKEVAIKDKQKQVFEKNITIFQMAARKAEIFLRRNAVNALNILQILTREGGVNIKGEKGTTPLHYAAHRGQLEMVGFLVDNGANIDIKNDRGETPLHTAAAEGQLDVIKYFVRRGGDVNAADDDGGTPLFSATANDLFDVVEYLVEFGGKLDVVDNDGRTALHVAAACNNSDIARYFVKLQLDVGARDKNGRTPLHYAAGEGPLDAVKFLATRADVNVRDNRGWTPLHCAIYKNKSQAIRHLVATGCSVKIKDNSGRTALHYAFRWGTLDLIKHLVSSGGNDSVRDDEGRAMLHYAASEGKPDTVDYFLGLGADVCVRDDEGRTALHYAASKGHVDVVGRLLDAGVDVDIADDDGNAALHSGAKRGDLEVVRRLVEGGADVNVKNKDGRSALHCAASRGYSEVVKYLVKRGVDFDRV